MTAITPPDAHLIDDEHNPELIKAKIISETARINWLELQKFYAAGSVISVEPTLDLVEAAFAFSCDDKALVADWLAGGLLGRTTEQQAQLWFNNKTELWAVVISPWVLVQHKPLANELN
ncbi:DUF2288 domain-containing protein [Rheinheimera sp. YQF-2]|uniref:DUF2288 domain-containing protein n=1 Tax=Rheinheimera lutimaris TaxID=2740584 RepID=A0A7Y5ANQ5_9GAMM|nr:DUF2288 domain-containing protein [Rheinheimera lutimaris]NRQ41708.1 DUF2288 domain-containing protein [Rheinheimera lutimaris]